MNRGLLAVIFLGCVEGVLSQETEIVLAPDEATDLFGNRKQEIKLLAYTRSPQTVELRAELFQIAGTLVVPVPQSGGSSLALPPTDAIKRRIVLAIDLPKVDHRTRFLLRFEGGGAVELIVYPELLLEQLRVMTQKQVKVYTLTSAGELRGFLEKERIAVTDLGARIPPEFDLPGIILAQRTPEAPPDWPTSLPQDQAVIVFHAAELDELPRIVITPFGKGLLAEVHTPILGQLSTSPRAQELFAHIINLVSSQLIQNVQKPPR